jgi:hypothetical protein
MNAGNSELKAVFKDIVLSNFLKHGYKLNKFPGSYTICVTNEVGGSIVNVQFRQLSYGDFEMYCPGIFYKDVEQILHGLSGQGLFKNTSLGQWQFPTFEIVKYWEDCPKASSDTFSSVEKAETFFKSYVEFMESRGFELINYYSSMVNMNEEMQKVHDIPAAKGFLWTAFGMGGTTKYCRGLIIAKLCNKYFHERLEKMYAELNYLINDDPDPSRNEFAKGILAEFETVLPYIHQIKPIYNL